MEVTDWHLFQTMKWVLTLINPARMDCSQPQQTSYRDKYPINETAGDENTTNDNVIVYIVSPKWSYQPARFMGT